jgi:hypothetical protein
MTTFEKWIAILNTFIAAAGVAAAIGSCQASQNAKESARKSHELFMELKQR